MYTERSSRAASSYCARAKNTRLYELYKVAKVRFYFLGRELFFIYFIPHNTSFD